MIAIPINNSLDDPQVDDRFSKCEKFYITDGNGKSKIINNITRSSSSGADGKVVKLLANEGVKIIMSPLIDPKAMGIIKLLSI